MSGTSPTERYQCVSRPRECKFEWNCGPLCACHVHGELSPQAKRDEAEAERRQAEWRAKKEAKLTMNMPPYPTTTSAISALQERSRRGDRGARERMADHWDNQSDRNYTERFLTWAIESFDPDRPNQADPLQSDFALTAAWRAWFARGTLEHMLR